MGEMNHHIYNAGEGRGIHVLPRFHTIQSIPL